MTEATTQAINNLEDLSPSLLATIPPLNPLPGVEPDLYASSEKNGKLFLQHVAVIVSDVMTLVDPNRAWGLAQRRPAGADWRERVKSS